jgi:TPR repeat protein
LLAELGRLDETTFLEVKGKAEGGDARAEIVIGLAYQDGIVVEKNPAEALRWYRQGAETGHPMGQCLLACSYLFGEGTDSDYREAVRWYGMAAAQEFWPAQVNLAFLLDGGFGARRDEGAALRLYTDAGKAGFAPALYEAGRIHLRRGVVERRDARRLLERAAEKGHSGAKYQLAELQHLETGIPKRRFATMYESAALSGHPMGAIVVHEAVKTQTAFGRKATPAACAWLRIARGLRERGDFPNDFSQQDRVELAAVDDMLVQIQEELAADERMTCDRTAEFWLSGYDRQRKSSLPWALIKIPLHRGCGRAETLGKSVAPPP